MLKYTSLTARIVIIHAHVKGSPDNSWRSMNTDGEGKPPGGTLGISGWGCAAGTLEPEPELVQLNFATLY